MEGVFISLVLEFAEVDCQFKEQVRNMGFLRIFFKNVDHKYLWF